MSATARSAALLALAAIGAGCAARRTAVLDRPEISRARLEAAAGEAATPSWEERPAPPADGHYFSAAVGDIDGDGIPDLVAGSFEPGGVSVWTGRPDGTWQFGFVPLPSSEARQVALADLDHDGRDEIVVVSRGGIEGLLVLRAPREGPWGSPDAISSRAGYEAVAIGDLNGDGHPDLVAARGGDREDGGIDVWLGDGGGAFQGGLAAQSGGSFRDVLLSDLDADGHLDLIAAGWGLNDGIRTFLGDGRGGFRVGPVLGVPGHYRHLALGDVTGDGSADLVATTYREGVRVFPGLDPRAEPCTPIAEGSFWSALLTDVDGDGTAEIHVSSGNGLGILTWTHDEGCRFRPVATGLPERDVWFGLALGRLHARDPVELIAAGLDGGIRVFAPAGSPAPVEPTGEVVRVAPAQAEERWARGNDTFTSTLGFAEYRLGVGDIVRVRVFNGNDTEETEATVQSDGEIFVPARGIGSLKASGSSPTQLKSAILERARAVWRNPDVEVVVLDYEAHKVALLGEVHSTVRVDSGPGQYALQGKTRVVEFLSKHGGPTERADLNRVQLIRPSGRSSYLNLYKAVFSSDPRENPILNDGDTVFVPSVVLSNRKVFVLGEVNTPGLLELRDNITLLEAIARAGGFNQRAALQSVIVIRGGVTAPELMSVNLKDILERGDLSADVVLRNGDIVYVPRRVLYDVKEAFAAIQPALDLIESVFIIHELAKD